MHASTPSDLPTPPTAEIGRRRLLATGAGAVAALGTGVLSGSAFGSIADDHAPTATQGSGFYRFRVGELELALIGDGGWVGNADPYGTNVSAEEREAACRAAFLDPAAVPGGVHCLLIKHPSATMLVDVGCGPLFGDAAGRLTPHLAAMGIAASDIDAVVLTHLHPDHIGGLLGETGAAAFPEATYHVSDVEYRFWADAPALGTSKVDDGMKQTMRQTSAGAIAAVKGRVERFTAGAELVPGVRTLDLPGHTPGHAGLEISSGGQTLAFMADVLHNAAIQLPNPSWHVAFDVDSPMAAATRARFLDRAATEGLRLCGSHVPFPALGRVARDGRGYRWVPEAWRWDV